MYEVDYLYVGDKTDTGDAIAFRFTHPQTGREIVGIIDGGFHETGLRMSEHVKAMYGTTIVDLVVCTHPDDDHINGLFEVFENLTVRQLLIHRPATYGYGPNDGVKSDKVEDLVAAATAQGTEVIDYAFAGTTFFGGALTIAGPSEAYYKGCLADQKANASASMYSSKSQVQEARATTLGYDPGETMTDDNGGTTARNNSSLIIDFQVEDTRVLFTGDAGAPALTLAADFLDAIDRSQRRIELFDVPHHGSRHNLTRDLVDRLLGTPTSAIRGVAIASVAPQADTHPRPEVANALKRRGYPVYCTRGTNIWWHSGDAPSRPTYTKPCTALDWLDE